MLIYLAGPLGFSEAGQAFLGTIIAKLEVLGHQVLNPWDLADAAKIAAAHALPYGPKKRAAWRKLNPQIGATNRAAIDRAQAVFAVLDGTDVDSGTAAEIGYAFARGKKILGYRGDFRLSADNDGAMVNLQVEYFIRESGGDIIFALAALPKALRALTAKRRAAP
jgi:nucleoside 2-deoxyribosyltransferase